MHFSFEAPFTYIVLGKSGSRKSTLVNHLLTTIFILMFKNNILIMSSTMKYSEYLKEFRDKIENNKKMKGEHF